MSLTSLHRKVLAAVIAAGLLSLGYWAGTLSAPARHDAAPAAATTGHKIDPKTGRPVLYWHDPMVPGQKFDKPGKSPFMDMQLVPVFADEGSSSGGVRIDPTLEHNLGIRYATVRRAAADPVLDLVGATQFDERLAEVVQSRAIGYIERLHARAPLQRVRRGEPIATIFVPEWLAAQEEYLALARSNDAALLAAARERMRALSIPDEMVARMQRSGKAQRTLTLTSPATGVVTELGVREGAMVSPGATIAKVNGLEKLWLIAEIPERQAQQVRAGQTVEASVPAQPARSYPGKILEVLPGVNAATRTIQARVELNNREAGLTPGQLVQVRITGQTGVTALLVPTEAVIASGKSNVVLVAEQSGIRPVNVTQGRELGDSTEILSGLAEGQKVVASGQFLIDSEARLKGVLPKMMGPAQATGQAAPKAPAASATHRATGRIEKISPDALTLSHGPVASLEWPAMTMDFAKPSPGTFADVRVGQEVEFTFHESPQGGYVLDQVQPAKRAAP
jgi:Cu(I)/Ag(I) efflux system membrane fusion protein